MNKNNKHIIRISKETAISQQQIQAVSELLSKDATIPFIARYRKEATGSLDEVAITEIRNRLDQLQELGDRKETILKSLDKHGHLNDKLKDLVDRSESLSVLEDIYLPYKPKRRTRATIAKEKGLEPLAIQIFEQKGISVNDEAVKYINDEKNVDSIKDALDGARDIIAEKINEDSHGRAQLRKLFINKGLFSTTVVKGKENDGKKYKDYFNWQEPVKSAPSHRVLAMRRGEKEDILNLSILPPEENSLNTLKSIFIKGNESDSLLVNEALKDCYKRLLSRSMETEIRVMSKDSADMEAIKVFSDNLRQLLLAPPLGLKTVMGIDPGFRTGCKVVCLDRQGKFLKNETIYPGMNQKKDQEAQNILSKLCDKYDIEAIAVGNGTAGRETEAFIKKIPFKKPVQIILVNESGASIYSASEIAREEFPDLDLTVRGGISIGRRLMDPLSELVKIDPKSIGVGQYQHDVDQLALKKALDDIVISCVNGVGVDVNRASAPLMAYVSGLGPTIAKNIVSYRDTNGPFTNRKQLKHVPRLGPKAFEQCAGFLRINKGDIPLDSSAVHPESYHIVDKMAADIKCTVDDLIKNKVLRDRIDINNYVTEKTGVPTLKDIVSELAKPGRDPRDDFKEFSFAEGVDKISDLEPGMKLPGIITNITAFGAFVDLGVHQDGLVHISQMSDNFVKDPSTIVKVHQNVQVTVLEVDIDRKRISLSMKQQPTLEQKTTTKSTETIKASPKKPARLNKKAMDVKKGSPFNNPFSDMFNKK